jgi:hypothetical protein
LRDRLESDAQFLQCRCGAHDLAFGIELHEVKSLRAVKPDDEGVAPFAPHGPTQALHAGEPFARLARAPSGVSGDSL